MMESSSQVFLTKRSELLLQIHHRLAKAPMTINSNKLILVVLKGKRNLRNQENTNASFLYNQSKSNHKKLWKNNKMKLLL